MKKGGLGLIGFARSKMEKNCPKSIPWAKKSDVKKTQGI